MRNQTVVSIVPGEAGGLGAAGGARLPNLASDTTYYDRPLLKQSVWSIDIPIYYFLGGTAGAALTLGTAIQLASPRGRHPLRRLSAICHWTGIIGSTAGAAFLIHDLGRPSRFLYMLRVFRPTSPMSMGVWILAATAPTAILTGLLVNRHGTLGRIGEASGYLSGVFGAALSGYTGVLVSNSVIPIWQEARRWMPVLFVASSAGAAGSLIDLLVRKQRAYAIARVFGTIGKVAELAAANNVRRSASVVPKVGEPFDRGLPGMLWNAASAFTAASAVLSLFPGRRRRKTVLSSVLGIAGSLCLRFAVHYLGNASARDARASFHLQAGKTPACTT
jgi:formate-dependent nitrite reductase membrane component NrfD